MTITDMPQSAAPNTPLSIPPPVVSSTQGPTSGTPARVSQPESGTGTQASPRKLTASQKRAAAAIAAAGLALAGIGLYLSFGSVADFAFHQLRFHTLARGRLFSVGVDVGIMVMIAIDLLMAWLKQPVAWIRYPVWLLTGSTVVLNAASGAPEGKWGLLDYVAAGAHGVVPILFITVVELARTSIDRVVRPTDDKEERDAIPLVRWVLAFPATARIYRRMRLWGISSYPEMVKRDQELIAYEQWLKRKHGGDLSKASDDELLPMTMAPYGYTVAQALALPDQQQREAEARAEEAERRRLEAETRRQQAADRAEADRLRSQGDLEAVRATVAGETEQARARARAVATAAERAADLEAEALESAEAAEAKARAARADQAAAEARKAAAETDAAAAETERAASETRRRTAEEEAARVAAEARRAAELERIEQAQVRAAQAQKEAAEIRAAAAEIERRAVEAEDHAKLTPRERAVRRVARMILNEAGGAADQLPLADIQRELAVSSPATASQYRAEAGDLLAGGYRP
jgi:hypothetical protein